MQGDHIKNNYNVFEYERAGSVIMDSYIVKQDLDW
jgi:hypothetical protein